ncbi:hypothetical protein PGIGA_G00189730 [Pangasianodon gigas]|uniref:Uncharacterized protein n=1 Tax=Pangasianodon gigas TaxID=30993 RepID=A0ACC5WCK0_PANGG|nr:hypothetical protein [Pangasianodon gigas]
MSTKEVQESGAPNCLAGVGESSSFTQRSTRAESGAHIRQPAHLRHIPRRLVGRGGLCTNCGFLLSSHSHTGRTEELKFIWIAPEILGWQVDRGHLCESA